MEVNDLIKEITKLTPPIDGNPEEWLERDYELMGMMWREFVCGSCRGLYREEGKEFQILAVQNTKKNDNFDRVLEWFEKSCTRDGYALAFLEVGNPNLAQKLQTLGFQGNETKMTKMYPAPKQ